MSDNFDMSAYMDVFMAEADEQLALLEESLVDLEKEATPDLLQRLFRAAHTLKGSSAAMGFTRMAELTHAMENVLDELRNEHISVTSAIVDVLLAGLDSLSAIKRGLEQGAEPDLDTTALTAQLRDITRGARPGPAAAVEVPPAGIRLEADELRAVEQARQSGANAYEITVCLKPGCPLKAIRAALVLATVRKQAELVKIVPPEEQIDRDEFGEDFGMVATTTDAPASIEEAINALSEIGSVTIQPIPEAAAAAVERPDVALVPDQADLVLLDHESDAVEMAVKQGFSVFVVDVGLRPGTPLKGLRATMAVTAAEKLGDVIRTDPNPEDIEEERFGDSFRLVLITKEQASAVQTQIESLSEIESAAVSPLAGAKPEPQVGAAPAPTLAPVAAAGPAEAPPEAAAGARRQATVRVNVEQLDNLMNLVAELVIDRTVLEQVLVDVNAQSGKQSDVASSLEEAVTRIGRRTSDLQDEIMKARMQPVDTVFSRFPRMLRDLAHKAEKRIDFQIVGGETELDRSVLEVIGDPLIHMLRNSVDHGIERPEDRKAAGKPEVGSIVLSARHEENYIVIQVDDDGKGIDPVRVRQLAVERGLMSREAAERMSDREAVDLIWAPGFSTAEKVSDVSGRGVGMDIVRNNVERLNGRIDVQSIVGQGTSMSVRLPLTLAIIQSLLVRAQGRVYALGLTCVQETERRQVSEIQTIQGAETVVLRGRVLPLIRFDWCYHYTRPAPSTGARNGRIFIVVVRVGEREAGIVVDELIGEQEIVIKSLGGFIGDVRGVSGATILGDGTVALIVDAAALLDKAAAERNQPVAALEAAAVDE